MKEPISVIMPVYNGTEFMKKTIAQLKAQTFKDFKCYLIDDCSTDDSVKIMKREIKNDQRFILIENEKNLGKPETLNKGLKLIEGEYVLMLDDDDEYSPTMFADLYNRAKKDGLDIAVCNLRHYDIEEGVFSQRVLDFSKIFEKQTYSIKTLPNDIFPLKLLYSVIWNKLFKVDFIRQNNLFFEDFFPADDTLFTLKAVLEAKKIGITDSAPITWRINNPKSGMGSLSRNDGYKNILKVYYEMEKCLRSHRVWGLFKSSYDSYPIEFTSGLMVGPMRGSDIAEILFNETKKYLGSIKSKGHKIDSFVVRVFNSSRSYGEFIKKYEKYLFTEAENIIAYNEAMIENLQNELTAIKNSRSYRLGRVLTAPVRYCRRG